MSVINAHKEEATSFAKATEKSIANRHENLASFTTKNILVVDNQREIALGLQNLLERNRKKVYVAHSVKDAKKVLEKEKIDVVITDITMPDESGMQLVEYIRDFNEAIQCIFYSINDNPAYIFRAKQILQIDAYVWKEEKQTDDDAEHAIMVALAHLEDALTGSPFYSAQIEKISETLNIKGLDAKYDGDGRKVFSAYVEAVRSNRQKKTDSNPIYNNRIAEKMSIILGKKMNWTAIEKALERYSKKIGFTKQEEYLNALQKIAKDFEKNKK